MNNIERTRQFNQREQGQSLTELAVSFMLIMFILAGAVDFGRAYFAVIALRDAAQEGVIYASINPTDVPGIEQRVIDHSQSPVNFSQFDPSYIDVSWVVQGTIYTEASPPANPCAGFTTDGTFDSNSVIVNVQYDFPFTMPLISALFPSGTLQLSVDDQHTILRPQCDGS